MQDFSNFVYFENQIKEKIFKEPPKQVRGDGHSAPRGDSHSESQQNSHSELLSAACLTCLAVRQAARQVRQVFSESHSITNFIDIYIPSTKVMIEQKSIDKDLRSPIRQSDGTLLNPFQQARKYISGLPLSQHPRWVVTCNFKSFLVYDMENPNGEPEEILLENLEKEYYRLQFLVNQKNENICREEEISLKAGDLVGKLYDALLPQYINPDENSLRSLNILCVRIVFCLYAEDAGLFETKTAFEDYIKSFALENLRADIIALFKALDTKLADRDKYDLKLTPFPYVNGGLFKDEHIEIPNFTQDIVDVIINHCAPFNWSEISPTIFGAVFESTLNPETRRKGGMHYTSIANIHKVIDPLFMDNLNAEFENICRTSVAKAFGFDEFIKVHINQFYGIEINDFAVTVAKTALWIAESQLVVETEAILSQNIDFLPLANHANIIEGNALRLDWSTLEDEDGAGLFLRPTLFTEKLNVYKINEDFGPFVVHDSALENATSLYGRRLKELNVVTKEVEEKELAKQKHERVVYDYIIGNPPFVGMKYQSKRQKEDMALVFEKMKCAFVSTNSITQGEQPAILWKNIFAKGIQIDFAYRTFKWYSESDDMAHVHCVIIGFSDTKNDRKDKFIIDESGNKTIASHINGYLSDADDIFIEARSKSLCAVSSLISGNKPVDGDFLKIEEADYEDFIKREPNAKKYIKKLIGGYELINNQKRYVLWLVGVSPDEIKKMPLVYDRVKKVREARLSMIDEGAKKLAFTPTTFRDTMKPEHYIVIPIVSSEKRRYVPRKTFSFQLSTFNSKDRPRHPRRPRPLSRLKSCRPVRRNAHAPRTPPCPPGKRQSRHESLRL